MANGYLGNDAIRPMEKAMWDLCHSKGYDPHTAFTGLLDYVIGFFDVESKPVENWRFDSEDNKHFYNIMLEWLKVQQEQVAHIGWYDAFGDLYMAMHSKGGGKGQYFTPQAVSQMIAEVNLGDVEYKDGLGTRTPFGQRITINDCAAGSGRLALAGYTVMLDVMQKKWGWDANKTRANRPYVIVEDLDYNCVKMQAINLAIHGCYGECVCHDTLTEPDVVRLGYIVGEADYPFPTGIPSIRKVLDPMRFVCTSTMARMKNNAERNKESKPAEPIKSKEKKQPQQLKLW